jgi:hypothetical protein
MMAPNEQATAERIVRLETKLDFIIDKIDRLPPSPICTAKHKELDDRLDAFETASIAWRNRIVGAVLIINIALVVAMDKIRAFLFHP